MTLGWCWPFIWQGLIWSLRLLNRKKKCIFDCSCAPWCNNTFKFNNLNSGEHLRNYMRELNVSCLSSCSKGFSSETTGPIPFKFHLQPPSKGAKIVYIFGPRWPTCPYMVKTSRNPLLQNHCIDCLVVVALLFYVHVKHLRSCRDGQLT